MMVDDEPEILLFLEAWAVFSLPAVMFLLAIIPATNMIYSGHGGFAWFLIPHCGPIIALRALLTTLPLPMIGQPARRRRWYRAFYARSIPAYLILALPLSWAATASIKASYGLGVSPWAFFAVMVSPFPWSYFT